MKTGAMLIFSTLVAVVYAVLFHYSNPSVDLDSGIISVFALAGIATCLIAAGLWKLVTR
jgi:uncharacterized membrane protein